MSLMKRMILFFVFLAAGLGVFFWLGNMTYLFVFLGAGVLSMFGFSQVLGALVAAAMGLSLIAKLFLGMSIIPFDILTFIVVGAAAILLAASGMIHGMIAN